jgi:16S rRNA (guanine1516-N2)-methyltransferase
MTTALATRLCLLDECTLPTASAIATAEALALPLLKTLPGEWSQNATDEDPRYALVFSPAGTALHTYGRGKQAPIQVAWHQGAAAHRRHFGGGLGQQIAKAVGVSGKFQPRLLDATAGLGQDAFVLASLGASVQLWERSPVVYALLTDGWQRAQAFGQATGDQGLLAILARLCIQHQDAQTAPWPEADVVYLDPMFPERAKKAAIAKSMRAFHDLVGDDLDADGLLLRALEQAADCGFYRVVVKRPRLAPFLAAKTPSHRLDGKSCRFDIYTFKKLPGL